MRESDAAAAAAGVPLDAQVACLRTELRAERDLLQSTRKRLARETRIAFLRGQQAERKASKAARRAKKTAKALRNTAGAARRDRVERKRKRAQTQTKGRRA